MDEADRRALMERYRHGYQTVADAWSAIDEPGRDRRPEMRLASSAEPSRP